MQQPLSNYRIMQRPCMRSLGGIQVLNIKVMFPWTSGMHSGRKATGQISRIGSSSYLSRAAIEHSPCRSSCAISSLD